MASIRQEGGDLGRGEHGYCVTCPAKEYGSHNCDPSLLGGKTYRIPVLCVHKDEVVAEVGGKTTKKGVDPYEMLRGNLRNIPTSSYFKK